MVAALDAESPHPFSTFSLSFGDSTVMMECSERSPATSLDEEFETLTSNMALPNVICKSVGTPSHLPCQLGFVQLFNLDANP